MSSGRKIVKELIQIDRLRKLKYYLGISFKQMGNPMFLSQSAYFSSILKQWQMEVATTTSTTMVNNINELVQELVSSEADHK